ncbi:MAG: hypothetical protein EB084_14780 [Proteobacteria bacterium]|nr:hypothetical protein [Pseudomonadota bacterium]
MVGGRYRLGPVVGKGGMGVVYAADDLETPGLRVAVKRMQVDAESEKEREDAVRLFLHEARVLRTLRHESIPRVHACFDEGKQYFLVMDLVEGCTLSELADLSGQRPPAFLPPVEQVLDWGVQIARVLSYLHAQQPSPVVYKDLKPDNLMLTRDGRVMLLDFGIAKTLNPQGKFSTILKGVGSPGFAAPEQYARQQSDPRADLYALGATLYALLTGQVPIESVDRQQALVEGRSDPLEPLSSLAPKTPRALEVAIRRLMAVRKTERTPSADEALKALEAIRDGKDERGLPKVVSRMLSNLWKPGRSTPSPPPRGPVEAAEPQIPVRSLEWIVGQGGLSSIHDAMLQASPGDVIRVRPGRYVESLVIDRPITLIGDGRPDDIVIAGRRGGALVVNGGAVSVRGLTLLTEPSDAAAAVEVIYGSLSLDTCRIASSGQVGVHVRGAASNASLRDCEITDTAEAALLVDDSAVATAERCEMHHTHIGIEAANKAEITARQCTVRSARGAGLYVHDEGRGTFDDCEIRGCGQAGVTVTAGADPLVRGCQVRDGKGRGLVIGEQSLGVFEDCTVAGNREEGVFIYDGANPELRRTRVLDSGRCGVVSRGRSYGLFEDCEIAGSFEAGVVIAEGADPILRRCRITRNFVAVQALPRAKGTVEQCDLRGNTRSVFDLAPRSQVRQQDNQE